ncbi:MAG TPA: RNA polymerase sigma factor [Bacteroidetes bacterium]|nr:RNA polymerase sigma factor [Bacteroidota bacterium]
MKLFAVKTEEEKLVQGCAKGRPQYQEALYNKYYRKMFGVCLRYTSNRETAEDVLQDSFIKIFKKIGSFSGKGSLEGWIRRIMVNTALEHHRKQRNMYPIVDMDFALDADAGHDIIADMSRDEILEIIQKLPPGYRTIFNLYAIEGYNHREIGKKLGISEGTSKSQLARARKTLQDNIHHLKKDLYEKTK